MPSTQHAFWRSRRTSTSNDTPQQSNGLCRSRAVPSRQGTQTCRQEQAVLRFYIHAPGRFNFSSNCRVGVRS